jgi:glyoxylate/hydroxypyruvate reductase A
MVSGPLAVQRPLKNNHYMALAIVIPGRDVRPLQKRLKELLPGEKILVYPEDIRRPREVEVAIVWNHSADLWERLPYLKLVCSFGAGVDHLIFDKKLPQNMTVTRIVDPQLTVGMRKYVCMAVLNFHKNIFHFYDLQQKHRWGELKEAELAIRPGVLGLGVLGADIAHHLHLLGFEVYGYSRRPKQIEGVQCLSEKNGEWDQFLTSINTLICVLPLTPDTYGILNEQLFDKLPDASYLINVGRGHQLIEADLLRAIKKGKIKGAFLDVFSTEPLPYEHPFWDTPEIVITPHIASITDPDNAARQIAANYLKFKEGKALDNVVDLNVGY